MKAIRKAAILLLLSGFACEDSLNIRTVALALDTIPSQVSTLSVFVQDTANQEVVATATLTKGQNTVLLGVPAEQPLLFSAIGYTDSPGPRPFEAMPAFVARSRRTIPLDRDRVDVSLTANRAGVLTFLLTTTEAIPFDETLNLEIKPEVGSSSIFPIAVPANVSQIQGSLVLSSGRYIASLVSDNVSTPSWNVENGRGIYVAPEFETLTKLDASATPMPRVVRSDAIEIILSSVTSTLSQPHNIPLGAAVNLKIEQNLESQNLGKPVTASWKLRGAPIDCLQSTQKLDSSEFEDLENLTIDFMSVCEGRAEIIVFIETQEGNVFWQSHNLNILGLDKLPGPPTNLILSLFDQLELSRSTELRFELLDADGFYSPALPGEIDLSNSDDWLSFANGPSVDLKTFEHGLGYRSISRVSGPRKLDLTAQAVVTSTAIEQAITATAAIPTIDEQGFK